MKKSAEKIEQLLNYEKLSGLPLLGLSDVVCIKQQVPGYIQCPNYEKAKGKLDSKMERYTAKVNRLKNDLRQIQGVIGDLKVEHGWWKSKASTFLLDRTNVRAVEKQNNAADQANRLLDKIESATEKHDELIFNPASFFG